MQFEVFDNIRSGCADLDTWQLLPTSPELQACLFSDFYIDELHSYSNNLCHALAQSRCYKYGMLAERFVGGFASLAVRQRLALRCHWPVNRAHFVSSTNFASLDHWIRVRSMLSSNGMARWRWIRRRGIQGWGIYRGMVRWSSVDVSLSILGGLHWIACVYCFGVHGAGHLIVLRIVGHAGCPRIGWLGNGGWRSWILRVLFGIIQKLAQCIIQIVRSLRCIC